MRNGENVPSRTQNGSRFRAILVLAGTREAASAIRQCRAYQEDGTKYFYTGEAFLGV
jgi:hypothetical protein